MKILFPLFFLSRINWTTYSKELDIKMNRVSLSLSLSFFLSLSCFRRSNKITSMCCRPTMTKDEKGDRGETSRADACYITRQNDRKALSHPRARALVLIVLDDRRYAQKSNGREKKKTKKEKEHVGLLLFRYIYIYKTASSSSSSERNNNYTLYISKRRRRKKNLFRGRKEERKKRRKRKKNIIINQC